MSFKRVRFLFDPCMRNVLLCTCTHNCVSRATEDDTERAQYYYRHSTRYTDTARGAQTAQNERKDIIDNNIMRKKCGLLLVWISLVPNAIMRQLSFIVGGSRPFFSLFLIGILSGVVKCVCNFEGSPTKWGLSLCDASSVGYNITMAGMVSS